MLWQKATSMQDRVDTGKKGQDVLAYSGRETPASATWSHTELQKTQSSKTCPELHQATTTANLLPYVISREKSQAAS